MDESNVETEARTNTDPGSDGSSGPSRKMVLGGTIAVGGIVTTGILVYVLERTGYPQAEQIVWILGYGLTLFALWYLLLRPLDLTGGE
jgi:hypothetical protein